MQRKGSAVWQGDLKTGKGTLSTDSGVLSQTQYSFPTRFESGKGTNPEELIAAAHAGCFTMAASAQLSNAGLVSEKLETTATVTFEKLEAGWMVTGILLDVKGRVPNTDQAAWEKVTQAAKAGCPISCLLNTTITMNAGWKDDVTMRSC
ncbi:MAG: OsmC family peroxiredoxin [Nitrospira sp. LK265]|nr:OsmC family protein [Nitrospira sp.]NGZ60409.1 OsmC family peroxiredoxin [Nitrospira sp. LK265]